VAELSGQGIAELGVLAASGAHLERPEVSYAKGARVTVERLDGERLLMEHDGDPRMADASITLDALAGAVPVIIP
jgi:diacylglycerol kinase (ATP)